jgi:hypothetical protein
VKEAGMRLTAERIKPVASTWRAGRGRGMVTGRETLR